MSTLRSDLSVGEKISRHLCDKYTLYIVRNYIAVPGFPLDTMSRDGKHEVSLNKGWQV